MKRYTFNAIEPSLLNAIVESNPILDSPFEKITIQPDFTFSTLLPAELNIGDTTPLVFLESTDQQDHLITEYVRNKEMANLYSVPFFVLNWLVQNFPSAGYIHGHSVMIDHAAADLPNGLLRLDIAERHFSIVAFQNHQVLLASNYTFNTPIDIVFYLLKICEAYHLSQEEVIVEVSGLFSTDAKIYRAIYDYFLNIQLKPTHWDDGITGCPAHYFTLLNEITSCESFQEI